MSVWTHVSVVFTVATYNSDSMGSLLVGEQQPESYKQVSCIEILINLYIINGVQYNRSSYECAYV